MKITKLNVATIQLNAAIQLFLNGDYLSSLTLSGAAEEILGKLSERVGKPVAVDHIADFHLKDTDTSLSDKKRKDVILGILNRGRNQAKHANDPAETHFDVEQIWPLQMIMRAL
ncbi:hypothetical protein, partial [Undibacterium sp.]|uniref:hypothetical protein n=1 Tax=Undibacterium sp. TaxID=1914977 RepID=UPI002C00B217